MVTVSNMVPINISMLLFIIYQLVTTVISQNVTSNSNLRCYYCELEKTNACAEKPDISVLPSVECSSMSYPAPAYKSGQTILEEVLSKSVDDKFRAAPLLGQILEGNTAGRALDFKYVCLKLSLASDGKKGLLRTCEKLPRTVEDACDFISNEMYPKVKILKCGSCADKDNCNSGSYLRFSRMMIAVGVIFVILHIFSKFA